MRNEEWFNFFTEFKTLVEQVTSEALDINEPFAVFLYLHTKADSMLEQIRKSNFTALIVEKDAARDNAYRGICETVRTAVRHYDPVRRAVAENLIPLIDHYGNVAERPYNEETATIYNFVQDLKEKYPGEITELDLNGWIGELERTNNDFEKTVLDRNREYAGKDTEMNMFEVRKQMDGVYCEIIERIEALALIRGDGSLDGFIRTLNANCDRYISSIRRRTGKSKTNNETSQNG
jgi:hypothetical protein